MSPNNKNPKKGTNRDDLWVDFMEDELDESLRDDLQKILDGSQESVETLRDLKFLKGAIRASAEDIKVPTDDAYYDNLHSKIMDRVSKEKVQSPVVVHLFRDQFVRVAAAVALVVVGGGIIWNSVMSGTQGPQPAGVEVAKSSQWLLESTARNPEVVPQTVISHEGEVDIYMDATADKLDSMSEKEAQRLLESLKD